MELTFTKRASALILDREGRLSAYWDPVEGELGNGEQLELLAVAGALAVSLARGALREGADLKGLAVGLGCSLMMAAAVGLIREPEGHERLSVGEPLPRLLAQKALDEGLVAAANEVERRRNEVALAIIRRGVDSVIAGPEVALGIWVHAFLSGPHSGAEQKLFVDALASCLFEESAEAPIKKEVAGNA